MPYGYPGPAPGPAQPEDDEQSSMNEMLRSVLEMLEPSPQYPAPQAPQQPGPGRRIMGGIGDALLSMASVRAGGGPVAMGPYAAQQDRAQQQYQAQLQEHEKRTMENAAADRVLRNQTRIGAFRGAQDLRQAKEVAGMRTIRAMRPQLRMVQTVDANGAPVTIPMEYDPATSTLAPMETISGQREFGKFVQPRTLASPTGFQNMDPVTGKVTPVETGDGQPVYPQPPAGVVSDIAASTANLQGLEALRSAYEKIRLETADSWDATKVVKTVAGETRLGGMLAPKYAEYTASRRASLNAYIKSVTGAQFSVAELKRYEGQYPEPWDDETLAEQKLSVLSQRAIADMQAKMRAFPGAAAAGPQQSDPLLEELWSGGQ